MAGPPSRPERTGVAASPPLHVAVLAAGKGTRLKSRLNKVVHRSAGLPLIEHVLRAADPLNPSSVAIVVGHQPEQVRDAVAARVGIEFVVQEPQLGTAHALLQTAPVLEGKSGHVLLLYGDVPLVRSATLQRLVTHHLETGAAATVLTAHFDDPTGYGRIVRKDGRISSIVEQRDATEDQRAIGEINSGIYVFDLGLLFGAVREIGSSNAQGEYYLTDLVRIYGERGLTVETAVLSDPTEIIGVNSRMELADVSRILKDRKNGELMAAGVTIVDPATTWIQPDVEIGQDTVIHPNVYLEGRTRIGATCEIHAGVRIIDSTIGDRVVINNYCVIQESSIESGAIVGPFARLRPKSQILEDAHVGNFLELKNTIVGRGSKANHVGYLGDTTIGEKVNIGAGTITCNYDGFAKHQTVIEDGVFIGSDSQLIAPVRIGRDAYVAAGSSITEDVPPGALAIGRGKQVNKEGWVRARRAKLKKD
jgi:bifunctional UDP-N-acetylglucosamine pyrophosphorylase / glucosamine-1-phosphate N-acetyltransferase